MSRHMDQVPQHIDAVGMPVWREACTRLHMLPMSEHTRTSGREGADVPRMPEQQRACTAYLWARLPVWAGCTHTEKRVLLRLRVRPCWGRARRGMRMGHVDAHGCRQVACAHVSTRRMHRSKCVSKALLKSAGVACDRIHEHEHDTHRHAATRCVGI